MNNTMGIMTEVLILVFNMLIFMELTVPKRDTLGTRMIMYIGGGMILALFFACTYFLHLPEAIASFICVTVPTATLYWILSKYKDTRFFVTFCFLDTVTYVVTFFARAIDIVWGPTAGLIGYIFVSVMVIVIYIKGKPYFSKYRQLMSNIRDGWATMALATALIYVLLIFATSYPKPLIERPEYVPVFAFLSVTILSFYVVFILSLRQKRKLYEVNMQLENEKKWHKIAYEDALTGLKNRMAYMERVNQLERTAKENEIIHTIMMDIDNFKKINDTLGHHIGDSTLEKTADILRRVFEEENCEIFRIGGDEFAVITIGIPTETVEQKLKVLNNDEDWLASGCCFSLGHSVVDLTQNNAIESAFIRADRAMYEEKAKSKV